MRGASAGKMRFVNALHQAHNGAAFKRRHAVGRLEERVRADLILSMKKAPPPVWGDALLFEIGLFAQSVHLCAELLHSDDERENKVSGPQAEHAVRVLAHKEGRDVRVSG